SRRCKIMMPSFPLWDHENHSSQARFFMIVHSRLRGRCNDRELSGCLFFQRQRISPVFSIGLLVFILRNHMRDSLSMEEVVRASGLNWTIARPPRLTHEKYSSYRSREDAAPKMGFTLSRKAVAAFMLDAIEQEKHFQKVVGIAK